MPTTQDRSLPIAAGASAALLATLCAMTLVSGVSQQWFEWVRPPDLYAARLAHDAPWLRAIFTVDDVFIAAYVTATVLLATTLARGRPTALHALVVAAGVAAGVLDLEENHHLLSLLRMVESGEPLPIAEIVRRSELSQLKWMLGHVAFVIVGAALVARDRPTRAFRLSLLAWQLPIGALCWTVDAPGWQPVLTWVRYVSMFAGFVAVAWFSRGRAPAFDGGVGSGAPA